MATWKTFYTRPVRLQDSEEFLVRPMMREPNSPITEMIYLPREGKMEAWFRDGQFENFLEQRGRLIVAPDWDYDRHFAEFELASRKFIAAAVHAAAASEHDSDAELTKRYQHFVEAGYGFYSFIWMPWGISHWLEDSCVEQLKGRYSDWQEMYEVMARTEKQIQTQAMIEAVWEWKLGGENAARLQAIVDQYSYLGGYSVNDSYWTAADIIAKAEPLADAARNLEHARTLREQHGKDFAALLERVTADDPQLASVVRTIHEYIWLRTERIDVYKKSLISAGPFFREVERRQGWPHGAAGHTTYQELTDALAGREVVTSEELQRREANGYALRITKDGIEVYSDPVEQAAFVQRVMGDISTQGQTEVRGRTACPGTVTARARVLLHGKDCDQMQKGEILIANMTHPDYMPAIRQAAAILTDEGGIVCHAAVISRELNIPCVIGTGDATKVFKTGDLVTVDATAGTARHA